MSLERLIIFTRYPVPGRAKTRLIPLLGPEGAADLQREMTELTVRRARQLQERRSLEVEVRFDDCEESGMRSWLGAGILYRPQSDGDLGRRLVSAFQYAFGEGMERVVIIGSDCPALSVEIQEQAFRAMELSSLVLGPAKDGGYYLVGLRGEAPSLFENIPWGTDAVLERTLTRASAAGLRPDLLEILDDVDRPEDLPVWEREKDR